MKIVLSKHTDPHAHMAFVSIDWTHLVCGTLSDRSQHIESKTREKKWFVSRLFVFYSLKKKHMRKEAGTNNKSHPRGNAT